MEAAASGTASPRDTLSRASESPDPDPSQVLLNGSPDDSSYRDVHPLPVHAFSLWQAFLRNVNPLSKVIHAPSVQLHVIEAAKSLDSLSRPIVALLFAIYTAGAMSMSDEDCRTTLGESRKTLLSRYLSATQKALRAARVMTVQDFTLLQAFTLYIVRAPPAVAPSIL